ncbi:MAG: hypothetical protein ACR2JE_05815 [Acidobacteriaceae bacterium]
MIHLEERLISQSGQWDRKLMALERHVGVALPGIVQSFDAAKQTVTVRLAVREVMLTTGDFVPARFSDACGDADSCRRANLPS